jgi:predicted AlkP superfamily phosphohydrolase/phosphomutase
MRRGAVIGLDGATWRVLRPMLEDGSMPALASLLDRSAWGVLRSTVPPYTPPAWTSAVTGVNPGRHGIFGFVQGRREPRLAHGGLIRSPAIWQILEGAGLTTGLFHLPLTFPPPQVHGWAVGAVWMPTARGVTGFTWPRSLEEHIRRLVPGYAPVTGVELFEDWRDPTLASRVTATLRDRLVVLADLLERHPVDLVWAVVEAPDRLQHAYYKYLDPAEPMAATSAAPDFRRAVRTAFASVDEIVKLLDDFAGPDGTALVCSDHGATGWNGYVFGNQLLAEAGLLRLSASGRLAGAAAAHRIGALARRLLPYRVSYRIRRRVQGLVDWERTVAYANRLGSQGFSVNLAGREPHGTVLPVDAAAEVHRLAGVLRSATSPSGQPLFQAVLPRDEVYRGPSTEDAPDLVVEPDEWRWEVSDAVGERGLLRDLSDLPLGCHHPDGVFALRSPGVVAGGDGAASILDVMPTLLYAMGAPVPGGLDGDVKRDVFGPDSPPVVGSASPPSQPSATAEGNPYSAEEEEAITRYLTDLGYLG